LEAFWGNKEVENTLVYLLNTGACTEEDLRKANEEFDKKKPIRFTPVRWWIPS